MYLLFLFCVQMNESDFKVLEVTEDSSLVLNQLHLNEQGTYRCSFQGESNGTVFYQVHFLLTGKNKNKISLKQNTCSSGWRFKTMLGLGPTFKHNVANHTWYLKA